MKCADLDTKVILAFLAKHEGKMATWFRGSHPTVPSVAEAVPEATPDQLLRAKMSKLIRKGLVSGCDCGCRGDYEITSKGNAALKEH